MASAFGCAILAIIFIVIGGARKRVDGVPQLWMIPIAAKQARSYDNDAEDDTQLHMTFCFSRMNTARREYETVDLLENGLNREGSGQMTYLSSLHPRPQSHLPR